MQVNIKDIRIMSGIVRQISKHWLNVYSVYKVTELTKYAKFRQILTSVHNVL